MEVEPRYRLIVKAGEYSADNMLSLLWEIIKHRFWHWRRGDGWVD